MKLKLVPVAFAFCALAACGGADVGPPAVAVVEVAKTPAPVLADDVPHGSWQPVARSPLKPRNNAVITWTGKEVLVFGGELFHCGGPMYGSFTCASPDDPPRRDGAAYNPAKDSWRQIARAPVPMLYATTAVVDDTVFVLMEREFFSYSLTDDTWQRLGKSPTVYSKLVTVGGVLVAYRETSSGGRDGHRDHYRDVTAELWRELPPTPKRPTFEREMVDVGGKGVLVGRPPNAKGDYSSSGLAAAVLDPTTLRWTDLKYEKGRNAANLVSYLPQPLHAADGKVVCASPRGDRLDYSRKKQPLIGGILDLGDGWSRLPERPLSAAERKARDEAEARLAELHERNGPESGTRVGADQPRIERFPWLNVGGDGFVVAGRWALDVRSGTWQHVPSDRGPVRLADASAIWAGDRVFAWGGARGTGSDTNAADGWTWRPARPD